MPVSVRACVQRDHLHPPAFLASHMRREHSVAAAQRRVMRQVEEVPKDSHAPLLVRYVFTPVVYAKVVVVVAGVKEIYNAFRL